MNQELTVPPDRRFRSEIPKQHRHSIDTRLAWLWSQRFGTVQAIYQSTTDLQDRTAATMVLQAIFGKDLNSIALILQRLEGGALEDVVIADDDSLII